MDSSRRSAEVADISQAKFRDDNEKQKSKKEISRTPNPANQLPPAAATFGESVKTPSAPIPRSSQYNPRLFTV